MLPRSRATATLASDYAATASTAAAVALAATTLAEPATAVAVATAAAVATSTQFPNTLAPSTKPRRRIVHRRLLAALCHRV